MTQKASYGGRELRDMFGVGINWLEKSIDDVNAINVFPVPDGDTGTNMFLTMRSLMEEADRALDQSVSEVAKSMAQGALMGARGNSGVILSQIFRGMAKQLEGKDNMNGAEWAQALAEASRVAYKGLSKPTEGTILTVMKDIANTAEKAAAENPDDMVGMMEACHSAAEESVARTPLLLPVLREAGVVDAGGQGLCILFEGMLKYLKGEADERAGIKPVVITSTVARTGPPPQIDIAPEDEVPYGYCTNFLLEGTKLSPEKIKARLEDKGESLVVVGDEGTVRVHIHTYDPGSVLRYATALGTLHQIQIQNMDDQHVGFLEMQREKKPKVDTAIVVVAAGDGMKEVFTSLGATYVVSGGQTMNPSVRDILQAVESIDSDKVIVLPNNKNIILTAAQVPEIAKRKVSVIPTRTMPQGVAALLAFNYETSLEENVAQMTEAVSHVKTVEVTNAVRSTQFNGLKIVEGQAIAIVDDENLVAAGDDAIDVLYRGLEKADIGSAEIITVYYGGDATPEEAERVMNDLKKKYSDKQIEVVNGGQPHYSYAVSLE